MPDLGTIGAALSSLKTATEIAKAISNASSSLEKAELKLQLADLMGTLADAKIELSEIQSVLLSKDELIAELEGKLKLEGETVGFLGARYFINENDEPTGKPYCQTCWAVSKDLVPLNRPGTSGGTHICGKCKNTFDGRQSPMDADNYIKRNREAAEQTGTEFVLKITQ
jgi:hypothetical protein